MSKRLLTIIKGFLMVAAVLVFLVPIRSVGVKAEDEWVHYKGKVNSNVNVRSGNGTNYAIVKDKNGKTHIETGFHAFRHYFISNCVKNGIPVSVVQQMVAHSSADMSLAYTHTFDADLRLPDYDGETERITLKKSTMEALNKAKGVHDLDDFIMHLLETGRAPTVVKHKRDKELDEALDEMFGK